MAVSGTNASEFTVTTQPDASTVSAGGTKTFVITFDPGATGSRSATVSIANDDSDENPYTFAIAGTGTSAPEIALSGNSTGITDGDTTPDAGDHTDFGSIDIGGSTQTRTFTITNSGSGALSLSGSPIVAVSGTNGKKFVH